MLTEQHIRYATGSQLASLLNVSPQTVSAWTVGSRHVSGFVLARAEEQGVAKDVLIRGLDLRVKDAQVAQQLQAEFSDFLNAKQVA